jgi:NAD(P)-dependent dehydrogenase (short-subunit alcohol dehydrogenase family)
MDLNLKGRTALVTGASKGIGLACAESLAAEGVNLHLAARSTDILAEHAKRIADAHGVNVTPHTADVSKSETVGELLAACGDATILVNNAGAIPGGNLEGVDEETWRTAWDLKVFGYINMTRAFFAHMREQGGGVIINITGLAGTRLDHNYIAGAMGNASLDAFTKAQGAYGLDNKVRVVAVSPGAIQTDRIVSLMRSKAEAEKGDPDRFQEYFANLPDGRAGRPEEVADVVTFLASDRASYVSGSVVYVDGGHNSRGSSFS